MRNKTIPAALTAAIMLASCSEAPEMTEESSKSETTVTTTTSAAATEAQNESRPDESQPDEQPEADDTLYDTSPISQAYLTGDTAGLDELQKSIYDFAVNVIDEVVTDGMDDYVKELAIHDYIVENVSYDLDMLGIFGEHADHAVDPYGALGEGKCICSGYTTTFQMFMDMLKIPCISIKATADGGEDHAWNMVQVNGHWYYVDVTWDDPIPDKKGRPEQHQYFNTTKEVMAERHEWDSSGDPVCDSAEDSYIAHELIKVDSMDDIAALMEKSFDERKMNFYFIPTDTDGWKLDKSDVTPSYISAGSINDELSDITSKFIKGHKGYTVMWQRMVFENEVIVAGYIINT